VLITKYEGRKPLSRLRLKQWDNIKIGVEELCEILNWFRMIQPKAWWKAVVNVMENLQVAQNVAIC
jgi:hypothetical protein